MKAKGSGDAEFTKEMKDALETVIDAFERSIIKSKARYSQTFDVYYWAGKQYKEHKRETKVEFQLRSALDFVLFNEYNLKKYKEKG